MRGHARKSTLNKIQCAASEGSICNLLFLFRFDVDKVMHTFDQGTIDLFNLHVCQIREQVQRSPKTFIRHLALLGHVFLHITIESLNRASPEYGGRNLMDVIVSHGIYQLLGNSRATIQALVARGGRLASAKFQKEIHEKRVFDLYISELKWLKHKNKSPHTSCSCSIFVPDTLNLDL
jgi:hypothetical protein